VNDPRSRPDSIHQAWIYPARYLPTPVTDAEGLVSLPGLIPGLEYKAVFTVDGREHTTEPFLVTPGKTVHLPNVELTSPEQEDL
jgi:hypothetical protein